MAAGFVDFEITWRADVFKDAPQSSSAADFGTVGISNGIAALTVGPLAVGKHDVVPDPWLEPKAYRSATDITVFVAPRMAHMHNFAGTRELLWRRIHTWGRHGCARV